MTSPLITIIVVPRERFSFARASLESIYEFTEMPFQLVYVDGNSPPKLRQYLEAQAQDRPFQLIRTDHFLPPNHARNLGLAQVGTPYVVFMDNDVLVSPGWLQALVQCAEETGAAVVGPLMCQDQPAHEIIHFAGGESHVFYDVRGRRRLREKMYKQGHRVAAMRDQLHRCATELAEFHCVLVRTDIFTQIGFLDEAMLNTKEHLDFCMMVRAVGGTIYFEPNALVTYVPGPPLQLTDIKFYMLRWSDAWSLNSLSHLRQKWNLAEDSYFTTKYSNLGWRRRETIILPMTQKLKVGFIRHKVERVIFRSEKALNRYLTDRYAERHSKQMLSQPFPPPKMPSTLEDEQIDSVTRIRHRTKR